MAANCPDVMNGERLATRDKETSNYDRNTCEQGLKRDVVEIVIES